MINKRLNELLKQAQGDRTQNQFALHCGIGSSTLTRFIKGERLPTPEVLKKIANKSYNGVSYEDLMNAVYGTPGENYCNIKKTTADNLPSDRSASVIERPQLTELQENFISEFKTLFSEETFWKYARIYQAMDRDTRIFILGYICSYLQSVGMNVDVFLK